MAKTDKRTGKRPAARGRAEAVENIELKQARQERAERSAAQKKGRAEQKKADKKKKKEEEREARRAAKVIPIRKGVEGEPDFNALAASREPARLIVSTPFDLPFFILVLVLLGFGLVMLFSASYATAYAYEGNTTEYISSQIMSAIIGMVLLIIVSFFNYRLWRKYAYVLLGFAILLLILVLIPGIGVLRNDARRWFFIFGMSFQPSELAKLAVIVWFSAYISKHKDELKSFKRGIVPFVVVLGIICFLLYKEPHMSGLVIIAATGIVLMFVGGVNLKYLIGAGLVGGAGIAAILFFTDYARARIDLWINPWLDPRDKGYQIIQSLIAIGSGGWMGLGLGNSRQKHLYIPEPQNDFIFSIVVEEIGFIGAAFILVLFAALIIRGYWIALHARDKFGSLLAAGITSIVALQTFLNIAVVTKLIPVTGVSLPFFSHGGSSLIILMIEMGIVLAVSRQIPSSE